jgi:hypothetical protein
MIKLKEAKNYIKYAKLLIKKIIIFEARVNNIKLYHKITLLL